MKPPRAFPILIAVLLAARPAPAVRAQQGAAAQPPAPAKVAHVTQMHGYTLKDDYFWLREKSHPAVIKHLEAEKNWKPYLDHNATIRIGSLTFFANHLVVSEREGGLSYLASST